MSSFHKNTWTDQLYRYTEYLYWTPQSINKKTPSGQGGRAAFEKTLASIRHQEVPLNVLFNILMRLLPTRIKNQVLNCFFTSQYVSFEQPIEFINIYDQVEEFDFTQPDVVLESAQARVCIELKVDALLTLNQVYKYLFLFGLWRTETGVRKAPYLYFLTKRELHRQWKTQERETVFTSAEDVTGLVDYLRTHDLPEEFGLGGSVVHLHSEVKQVMDEVTLGWTSWQSIGNVLDKEVQTLDTGESSEILERLLGDFLDELRQRELWG